MKKDIQRLGLAIIIGSLAIITGCEQKNSNDAHMKGKCEYRSSDDSDNQEDHDNGY